MDLFLFQRGNLEEGIPAFACVCDGVSSLYHCFKEKTILDRNIRDILGLIYPNGVYTTDKENFGHPNELIPGYVMAMIVADEIRNKIESAYRSVEPDYLGILGCDIDQNLVDAIILRMNSDKLRAAILEAFGNDHSHKEYQDPKNEYFSIVAFATGLAYATVNRANQLQVTAYGDVKIKVILKDGSEIENEEVDQVAQLGAVCSITKNDSGVASLSIQNFPIDRQVYSKLFDIDQVEQVEICTDGVWHREKEGISEQFDDETRLVITDVRKWAGLD